MKPVGCPHCGRSIPFLARACSHCGEPNPALRKLLVPAVAVSAVVAALIVAIVVVAMSGRRPSGDVVSSGKTITGTDENFAWLSKAMDDCDKQATKEPGTLQFLVTPLVDDPPDDRGWRRISINDIGNAILIKGEDTVAGLKRRALRITTKPYVFNVRDEGNKVVYRWADVAGVRHLVIAEGATIESFKVQFESADAGRAASWGSTFTRQPGNCYWVNAIVRD